MQELAQRSENELYALNSTTGEVLAFNSERETFMGTIIKNGENFVLSDSATKTGYTLDNPKKASAFEGKKVKVTGTLDKSSHLIHVETIQGIV